LADGEAVAVAEVTDQVLARGGRGKREQVGLGAGGVFANTLLAEATARLLRQDGFTVLRHRRVPPNDGGLALGQIVVAARTTPLYGGVGLP
ncbi:Kae1-like domain-containing protein, partial [Streptomyces lydicus]|uniref:Kae1-like domain-containing protein n=1 Tax=Streptomyces lydicus TaxID=47763 RepID=UPI00331A73DB